MANVLVEGQPRIGWVSWEGNDDAKPFPAMLEDTGGMLRLRLPFPPGLPFDYPLYCWWVELTDERKEANSFSFVPRAVDRVPRLLRFWDVFGSVILVGCHLLSYHESFVPGVSVEGRVRVQYAVLGAQHSNYAKVNAVRTQSPGISKWFGLTGFATKRVTDEQGRLQSLTFEPNKIDVVPIRKRLNLSVNPAWSGTSGHQHFEIDGPVYVETQVSKPRTWEEHLLEHERLLNLACLSAWQPFRFTEIFASRDEDPQPMCTGQKESRKWNPVVTHRGFLDVPGIPDNPRFLFRFADIGLGGVRNWLRLSEECGEAIAFLMNILRSGQARNPIHVLSVGAMLEEIAAYILKKKGTETSRINRTSYESKMKAIIEDLPLIPFDNPEVWAKNTRDVYTASKHAGNDKPDLLKQLEVVREGILAARIWIACKLGAEPALLENCLQLDPLATKLEYIR